MYNLYSMMYNSLKTGDSGFKNLGLTCFLNASLQLLKPHVLSILSSVSTQGTHPSGRTLTLLGKLYNASSTQQRDSILKEVATHISRKVSDVEIGRMGDGMLVCKSILDLIASEDPWTKSQFSLLTAIPQVCQFCQQGSYEGEHSDKPELVEETTFSITRTGQVSHQLLQELALKTTCKYCNAFQKHQSMSMPQHLVVRCCNDEHSRNAVHIDRKIQLKRLTYNLTGVMCSSGFHATSYVKNLQGQWNYFNDQSVTSLPHESDESWFFIVPSHLFPIGVTYTLDETPPNTRSMLGRDVSAIMEQVKLPLVDVYDPMPTMPKKPVTSTDLEDKGDYDLHSRQLSILGGLNKLQMAINSEILLVNINGTSLEIAKNLICIGFSKITFWQPDNEVADACWKEEIFCCPREEAKDDPPASRMEVVVNYLKSLVPKHLARNIRTATGVQITDKWLAENEFSLMVVTQLPLFSKRVAELNDICRKSRTCFIATHRAGLLTASFADFIEDSEYLDVVGDPDNVDFAKCVVAGYKIDESGFCTVQCLENRPNAFKDGDKITYFACGCSTPLFFFRFIREKCENDQTLAGPLLMEYEGNKSGVGGFCSREPQSVRYQFKSMADCLKEKIFHFSNDNDLEREENRWMFHTYLAICNNVTPPSSTPPCTAMDWNKCDPKVIIDRVHQQVDSGQYPAVVDFDDFVETKIGEISLGCCGLALPMITFQGAIITHVMLSALTKQFTPLNQWLFVRSKVPIPLNAQVPSSSGDRGSTRQRALFGDSVMDELEKLRVFQVGCGATGCESAKILTHLKVKSLVLSDMDSFEPSNQTRQFISRFEGNLQKNKSLAVSEGLKKFSQSTDISAYPLEVSDRTCSVFSDSFFETTDVVFGTVDNVTSRKYLSDICDFHGILFLECGVERTMATSSSFYPLKTAHYFASEEREESILGCSTKTYPYKDVHTVKYAIDLFKKWFEDDIMKAMGHWDDPEATEPNQRHKLDLWVEAIKEHSNPLAVPAEVHVESTQALIEALFNEEFVDGLNQHIATVEHSASESEMWTHLRRKPVPTSYQPSNSRTHKELFTVFCGLLKEISKGRETSQIAFNKDCPLHLQFVQKVAEIRCEAFNISFLLTPEAVHRVSGMSPSFITATSIAAAMSCMHVYVLAAMKCEKSGNVMENAQHIPWHEGLEIQVANLSLVQFTSRQPDGYNPKDSKVIDVPLVPSLLASDIVCHVSSIKKVGFDRADLFTLFSKEQLFTDEDNLDDITTLRAHFRMRMETKTRGVDRVYFLRCTVDGSPSLLLKVVQDRKQLQESFRKQREECEALQESVKKLQHDREVLQEQIQRQAQEREALQTLVTNQQRERDALQERQRRELQEALTRERI